MSAGVPTGAAGDPGGDECACRGTGGSSKAGQAEAGTNLVQEADAVPGAAVKQYLRETVVVPVEEAMLALVKARPADPIQFLIDHLVSAKAQREA